MLCLLFQTKFLKINLLLQEMCSNNFPLTYLNVLVLNSTFKEITESKVLKNPIFNHCTMICMDLNK